MNDSNEWIRIDNQRAAEHLLDITRGFHDGVTTSATWKGAEFINGNNDLELHGYGDLHLRISSQLRDIESLELKFVSVQEFRYDYDSDMEGHILIEPTGATAELLNWVVRAQGLEYRVAPGPDRRMVVPFE